MRFLSKQNTINFIAIVITALAVFGIFFIQNQPAKEKDSFGGLVYYPPGLGMYENYTKNAETYESKLGYSFQYPPHLSVMEDMLLPTPERIFILGPSTEDDEVNAIVISVAENDENMTPLEWLDSPASGANLSQEGYLYEWNLDGQEAIAIENGLWVVVNTPDEKYRLSIATLPGDSTILLTEMGIIIDSLRFPK